MADVVSQVRCISPCILFVRDMTYTSGSQFQSQPPPPRLYFRPSTVTPKKTERLLHSPCAFGQSLYTWDWTRMHALVVMHRWTLCENVDSAKIKVPFILQISIFYAWHRCIVSSHIVSIYRSISMNRYTPSNYCNFLQYLISYCVFCNTLVITVIFYSI